MSVSSVLAPYVVRAIVAAADSEQFADLVSKLEPALRRHALRRTRDDLLVDDLVQHGRFGIAVALERFDSSKGSSLEAFARACAIQQMDKQLRKERRHGNVVVAESRWQDQDSEEESARSIDGFADELSLSPCELVDSRELASAVEQFSTALSEELRITFEGLFRRELSGAELARELGLTRAAIGKRRRRIELIASQFTPFTVYEYAA